MRMAAIPPASLQLIFRYSPRSDSKTSDPGDGTAFAGSLGQDVFRIHSKRTLQVSMKFIGSKMIGAFMEIS